MLSTRQHNKTPFPLLLVSNVSLNRRQVSTTKNSQIFYLENSILTKCYEVHLSKSKSTAMKNGLTPISLLNQLDSEYWAVLVTLPFSSIPKISISIWQQTPLKPYIASKQDCQFSLFVQHFFSFSLPNRSMEAVLHRNICYTFQDFS